MVKGWGKIGPAGHHPPMTGGDLKKLFDAGTPQTLSSAFDDVQQLATKMSDHVTQLKSIQARLHPAYQGSGGDAASSATQPLGQAHEESTTNLDQTAATINSQQHAFQTAQTSMKDVPGKPDEPSMWASIGDAVDPFGDPATESYMKGMQKNKDANDANVHAYNQYHSATTSNQAGISDNYPLMKINHGSMHVDVGSSHHPGVGDVSPSSHSSGISGATSAASFSGPDASAGSSPTPGASSVGSPSPVGGAGGSSGGGGSFTPSPVGSVGSAPSGPGGVSGGVGGVTPSTPIPPNTPTPTTSPGGPLSGGSLPPGETSGIGSAAKSLPTSGFSSSGLGSPTGSSAAGALAAEEAGMAGGMPPVGGAGSASGVRSGSIGASAPKAGERVSGESTKGAAPVEEEAPGKGASSGVGAKSGGSAAAERLGAAQPKSTPGSAGGPAGAGAGKKKEEDKEHEEKFGPLKEEMDDGVEVQVDETGVRTVDEKGFTVTKPVIGE